VLKIIRIELVGGDFVSCFFWEVGRIYIYIYIYIYKIVLILSFRRVLNEISFLLGVSPASEC
jgi:hypothetical protein